MGNASTTVGWQPTPSHRLLPNHNANISPTNLNGGPQPPSKHPKGRGHEPSTPDPFKTTQMRTPSPQRKHTSTKRSQILKPTSPQPTSTFFQNTSKKGHGFSNQHHPNLPQHFPNPPQKGGNKVSTRHSLNTSQHLGEEGREECFGSNRSTYLCFLFCFFVSQYVTLTSV